MKVKAIADEGGVEGKDELTEAMAGLSVRPFTPSNPSRLLPELSNGTRLYILFKKNLPLNPIVEIDERRARGFVSDGYLQKVAMFSKSSSSSGNVVRLQDRGLFVMFVNPLQPDEKIYVFAHRGNVNTFLKGVGSETSINVFITMANFAP